MISVLYYVPWDFAGAENGTITQWGRASTAHPSAAASCAP